MRIFDKLQAGRSPVVIGYMGGSITAGVGATNPASTSWRALTTRWFRERFPAVEVRELDASLRGTGSELAAYRLEKDLLRYRPDIVFVEFSVNDHRLPPAKIIASMEGLIRRTRRTLPLSEIIIVLATMQSLAERHSGRTPSAYAHEKVATHYEVPTVEVDTALLSLTERGEATWESLTTDGCHPNDLGHAIYARKVRSELEKLVKATGSPRLLLPEPLSPVPIERGKVVPISQKAPRGWWFEDEPVGPFLRGRLTSNVPGVELSFSFTGETIGLYWLVAKDSGAIEYVIDEGKPAYASAWDAYALRFSRAHYRILADKLAADQPHVLRLWISSSSNAQSDGSFLRIGAFLINTSQVLDNSLVVSGGNR